MGEDRIGQIVKIAFASLAVIALPFTLALVQSGPLDLVGLTPDASDTIRPAYLAHALIALRVVYQIVNSEHTTGMLRSFLYRRAPGSAGLISAPRNSY
jgi:hypothetical protein